MREINVCSTNSGVEDGKCVVCEAETLQWGFNTALNQTPYCMECERNHYRWKIVTYVEED